MKRVSEKQVDKPDVKSRLLEAGIRLFAENGYTRTSVREIVAQAGVTKPVLYYYFKNKAGLLNAILDRVAEEQEALIEEALKTPGSVLDRLMHLYRKLYMGVLENQVLFKMIHKLVFGPPQGIPEFDYEQFHVRTAHAIKVIYAEGLAKNEVIETNADDMAVLFLSLLDFCIHMDCMLPELRDPERPERLLRLAIRGLDRTLTQQCGRQHKNESF